MEWGNCVSKRGGPDDVQELDTAFAMNRRNIIAKIMYGGYDSPFFLKAIVSNFRSLLATT
jgi:hypothetical protein